MSKKKCSICGVRSTPENEVYRAIWSNPMRIICSRCDDEKIKEAGLVRTTKTADEMRVEFEAIRAKRNTEFKARIEADVRAMVAKADEEG